ncbi:MAG: SIS domain-containing protein [Armatimonadetes bacterium]|nr:SIS domain-containing protein [Anaerolineae bacterium]
MSHLEREIAEQPQVLRTLLRAQAAPVGAIAAAIKRFQPAFVQIAARGTSDNAARYAQYLMGIVLRMPVGLAAPSVHTLYGAQPNLARALVIGISQSGKSVDVLQVISDARAQGALTLSITNDANSPLAQAAEYHIPLHAGEERAVAATKTYTAELAAVALLVTALADDDAMRAALNAVPDALDATLTLCDPIAGWAQRYRYMPQLACIGRGYNYCTAFEINLKVTELCYITGVGFSEADFLHGPIAQISPGFPVLVVAPSGKTLPTLLTFLEKLKARQAEALVIASDEAAFVHAQQQMRIPAATPEWLTPITAVMPGQVFAMQLAAAKGYDLDNPLGLTKVTLTL